MAEEQFKVVLEGYKELTFLLKKVDPELRREMDREIRYILRPITLKAKSYVPVQPLSGWNYGSDRYYPSRMPFWNYDEAVKGIDVRQGSRRRKGTINSTMWRIRNASASGSVFELAGRKNTSRFATALSKVHHRPSRLIWRAWDEAGGAREVGRKVVDVIDDYVSVLRTDVQNIVRK